MAVPVECIADISTDAILFGRVAHFVFLARLCYQCFVSWLHKPAVIARYVCLLAPLRISDLVACVPSHALCQCFAARSFRM